MARRKVVLEAQKIEEIRQRALRAIAPLKPPEKGQQYRWGDRRTQAGGDLPEYYLVYFLLVELLGFPSGGRWEKVAWTIPVDMNGNAALIEHRKMGLGVFSETTDESEAIAAAIVAAVRRGVGAARPFFDHLAAEAVSKSLLNVTNNCAWLFSRYTYLREQFRAKAATVKDTSLYAIDEIITTNSDGTTVRSFSSLRFSDIQEARWLGIAVIDAFFSWTEHVLIHVGILLGNVKTGEDVARLADGEWSEKVKAAIDLSADTEAKTLYEDLLEIRRQIRNFMAHGAFGKQGEAFQFHSAAGAVPVNLSDSKSRSKYSIFSVPSFDEHNAMELIEKFIVKLWEGDRGPAKLYLEEASLPVILTYASDGTYAAAMSSQDDMENFVECLTHQLDNAANMDW
jgi:hypothetical protein